MTETKEKLVKTIVTDEICIHCGKNLIKKVLPKIFGREIIGRQLCECQRKHNRQCEEEDRINNKNHKISRLLEQSRLGERFKSSTFEKITITNYNKELVENLQYFSMNFEKDKSFFVKSHPGTGKTLIASATVNKLVLNGKSAIFVIVPDILQRIRDSWANDSQIKEKQILYGLAECDCLVLDDLGAENSTDFASEKLFMIINSRYNNMKSTIFTSNCNAVELKKKVGDRTVSRILEMCKGNIYKLDAEKDWRI